MIAPLMQVTRRGEELAKELPQKLTHNFLRNLLLQHVFRCASVFFSMCFGGFIFVEY